MDNPKKREEEGMPDDDCAASGQFTPMPVPVIEAKEVFGEVKEGSMKKEEIVLSKETVKLLKKKAVNKKGVGCFLCSILLEDQSQNGHLTGHPNDIFGKGTFSVEAKVRHVKLEKRGL